MKSPSGLLVKEEFCTQLDNHEIKCHNRIMANVSLETEAADQFLRLPSRIKDRVGKLMARLEYWPDVSGAKPLQGKLAGRYRMRTGDYRLQFRVEKGEVVVEKVGHRERFYED